MVSYKFFYVNEKLLFLNPLWYSILAPEATLVHGVRYVVFVKVQEIGLII